MYKNRKSNRLKNFDYSTANLYFITSCLKYRIDAFGYIENGVMILNEYGYITQNQWYWLAKQYPYVLLHEFVVMPDHVHGIIEIVQRNENQKIKSVSELVGAYKTTVSKKIRLCGFNEFAWQRSFHDRIIRNDVEYYHISRYIHNNPGNWKPSP